MKTILIIEGIATSGKTSLVKEIVNQLGEDNVHVYSESETHIPIAKAVNELHISFFNNLIADALKSPSEFIIFDRLYFTQAIRAGTDIVQYRELEDLLLKQNTLVVYLQIDESRIEERIESSSRYPRVQLSSEHSGENWSEYLKTKGGSAEEIAAYYTNQQRRQIRLLEQSKLKSRIFNATSREYKSIAKQIIGLFK